MFSLRATLLVAAAVPAIANAQRVERISLRGNKVAIYNIAGKITVEPGSGSAVVVEVTREGSDARRLQIEEKTIDGRAALCVVYPDDAVIYHPVGMRGRFNTSSSTDNDCIGGGSSRGSLSSRAERLMGGRGHRVEVRSDGDGVEAWADIRILVPAGHDVKLYNMAGGVEAFDVDATLNIDVSASGVTTNRTRGELNIEAGSGGAHITGHRGGLSVEVGSGGVELQNIDGPSVRIETGSGGLKGGNIATDNLSLETGSGGVEFSQISARRTRVETGSGGARLGFASSPETIDIDAGSGTVTLGLPSNYSGQVDIETGSGGIQSDFTIEGTSPRSRRNNEIHGTIGSGRGRLKVDTGSGGVRLVRGGDAARRGTMR